jgi:predicted PurR-regulated permease PerM
MGFKVSRRLRVPKRDPDREADRPPATGPPVGDSAQGAEESAPPGGAASPIMPTAVVPRWIQLVVLPLALLGLWALARASGPVLLVLIAASTVALILNPLVQRLHRHHVPRGLAILILYVGGFAVLAGVIVLLSNPVSTQVSRFSRDVPAITRRANRNLADFQNWLNRNGIHVQIKAQGQTALQTLQKNVLKGSGNIVSFTQDVLGRAVTVAFYLVLVLVLSIYLLVYGREIGGLVRRIMPPGDGTPEDDFPRLVQRAVFGYVRGQLLFSLIMGASAALALWIIGTIGIFPDGSRYALFFGGFYGVMELIPYIGPFLGALPPVVIALFNDPLSAVWVALMFVGLQQLEGHVVAPQVFRISLRINPIIIILSLLIGNQIYGVAGALVALPVAAVLRETVMYLRRHLVLEPWVHAGPGAGLEDGLEAGPASESTAGSGANGEASASHPIDSDADPASAREPDKAESPEPPAYPVPARVEDRR